MEGRECPLHTIHIPQVVLDGVFVDNLLPFIRINRENSLDDTNEVEKLALALVFASVSG